jgi:hypothetical protein
VPLVLAGETLPGLCFVDRVRSQLPSPNDYAETGWKFYDWYYRRASVKQLGTAIGRVLALEGTSPLIT